MIVRGQRSAMANLVAPKELIAVAVLETIPGEEELGDAVIADVVCIFLGFFPGERRAHGEEAHCCIKSRELRR